MPQVPEEAVVRKRRYWVDNKTFRTPEFKDLDTSKPKFYALDMFPYPRHRLCCRRRRSHAVCRAVCAHRAHAGRRWTCKHMPEFFVP